MLILNILKIHNMFIELIDTCGKKRYINPDHIQEIKPYIQDDETLYSICFAYNSGCSHFTKYNIDKLINING